MCENQEKGEGIRLGFYYDKIGNLYKGTVSTQFFINGKSKAGVTDRRMIEMFNIEYWRNKNVGLIPLNEDAGNNPALVAHEILHTMGLFDSDEGGPSTGRMKYTATTYNNFQLNPISNEDIEGIIKYAIKNNGLFDKSQLGSGKDEGVQVEIYEMNIEHDGLKHARVNANSTIRVTD